MNPRDVLSYLADLAPEAGTSSTVHVRTRRDLLMLTSVTAKPRHARFRPMELPDWLEPSIGRDEIVGTTMANTHAAARERMFPLRFFYDDDGVDRFAKIDALSPADNLLRLGFLWLSGRAAVDGRPTTFLLPIVSATVIAHSSAIGRNEFELVTDFQFEPSLGTSEQWDVLEEAVEQLLLDIYVNDHFQVGRRIQSFARKLSGGLGLPQPAIVAGSDHPYRYRNEAGFHLIPGMGVYLARGAMGVTLAATLRSWRSAELANTAFDALYRPPAESPADPSGTVESPVHLNARQRQAVVAARDRPVSVVSGPPGTGKSHLVAAMAVDEVARGKTVLVATQSDHAAQVVADHLAAMHAPGSVRFGREGDRTSAADYLSGGISEIRRDELRELRDRFGTAKGRLEETLTALTVQLEAEDHIVQSLLDRIRYPAVRESFPNLDSADLASVDAIIERHGQRAGWWSSLRMRGLLRSLGAGPLTPLDDVRRAIAIESAERSVRRAFQSRDGAADLWEVAAAQAEDLRRLHGEVVQAEVRRRAWGNRRHVAALASALRSGRLLRRQILRESDFADALEALPLWIGTLSEIDDTLPASPAVFDLVIFDEASQIDQIRAATALMRAKRTVVVGDPRQLRHVSFTADAALDAAASAHGISGSDRQVLDIRRNSLFDAAAAAAPVVVLEEHFRSAPHIIEFSNRAFYGGVLRLMTQHPSTEAEDVIDIVAVDGARDDDGANRAEVEAAVDLIERLEATSIAVVSPFRAQADALEAALAEAFTPDQIRRRALKVGTVHAMQGSERDVLVVSLAIDARSLAAKRFIEDRHLFNTMITRARDRVILLTSFDKADIRDGLLADYLKYSHQPPSPRWDLDLPRGWIGDIGTRLRSYGLRVVPGYPVAGWSVDLAVGTGAEAVGVICGVHEAGAAAHIERHSALHRAGWELIDAFESVHLAFPEEAVEHVVERVLARMGPIRPVPLG